MEQAALQPKVSIVVITYQQVDYIAQCLDGILMQRTEWPIEILVGDDGSTDGTREICMHYAQEHPDKVKLFVRKQSDRNPAHPPGRDNLLALLNAAEGEYITRCDGDDYWTDPEKLQRQVDHLDTHPEHAGCFHLVEAIDEQTGVIERLHGDHAEKLHFTLEDTLTVRSICHPCSFMYRHAALPQLPDWLGRVISADMAMYSLVAGEGALYRMGRSMGVYRKHGANITASDAHQGSMYHRERIILWLHIDRHFGYRFTARCEQLFRHHWRYILRQNTPQPRGKYLWMIVRAVPGWFLAKPSFAMGRLKEVYTGKARRLNAALFPLPYIAIVTPNRGKWSETFISAHIKRLREHELVLTDGQLPTKLGDGTPILNSTPGYRWRNRWEQKVLGWSLARMLQARIVTLLKRKKIEVVLAEYGRTGEAMLSICQELDLPLVVHFHGVDAHHDAVLAKYDNYRRIIGGASAFIVVSRVMEQQLLALGAPREKVFYNCYGVDVNTFQMGQVATSPPHLLAVGRFVEKKAPLVTLLAFSKVLQVRSDARLTMVGQGPLWEGAQQLVRAMDLGEQVQLPGVRTSEDIAALLRGSRAFVQHSVVTEENDREGTPLAVLEAMATGIPVIATRHAGIADVVAHGERGLLCEEFDAEGMAENMLAVLNDMELASRMGAAGRAYVVKHHRVEDQVGSLQAILEQVVQRHGKA